MHKERIEACFRGNVRWSGERIAERLLLVCFTNRSGSNYVCHALHSTGLLPLAREWLNHDEVEAAANAGEAGSFQDYLRLVAARHGRDGLLALKAGASQAAFLRDWGYLEGAFGALTPAFVSRRDRLDQAVSFHIASQTRRWSSQNRPKNDAPPLYDFRAIGDRMRQIDEDNAAFEAFFKATGLAPIRVVYEDFVAAPKEEVARIGMALGLRLEAQPQRVPIRSQSTARNALWRRRYLNDAGARPHLPLFEEAPGWAPPPAVAFIRALYGTFGRERLAGPALDLTGRDARLLALAGEAMLGCGLPAGLVAETGVAPAQRSRIEELFSDMFSGEAVFAAVERAEEAASAGLIFIREHGASEAVVAALDRAERLASATGVVALLDFLNPGRLEVSEGFYRRALSGTAPDLLPFAFYFNALWLCRPPAFEACRDFAAGFIRSSLDQPWMERMARDAARGREAAACILGRRIPRAHS